MSDSVFNAAFQWIGFFCFIRMHLSRVLQFFLFYNSFNSTISFTILNDGNSVLLPLPDSSILIPTTFPGSKDVLLSNLTAEENREVQDG